MGEEAAQHGVAQPQAQRETEAKGDSVLESVETRGHGHKLGEWSATAICGNDITSSCLYVAALASAVAGCLAPVALLLVAATLYLFRKIYGEVVTALPLNGGAYNALLNTTSKFKASVAACLTILSYIATAVISATVAMNYLHELAPIVPVLPATVALLFGFAVLVRMGISESAAVALGIFCLHITTLTVLVFTGAYFIATDPGWSSDMLSLLERNLRLPVGEHEGVMRFIGLGQASVGTIATALLFGFGTGLLGISGFESSANFVEEQQPGVFVKTLRNMWVAVTIFNPLIALIALGVLPLEVITAKENSEQLLAVMAQAGAHEGGLGLRWGGLKTLVVLDATLVLSGAVLTSYVGVTGLVRRMALDRCLPQFLLEENRRGTAGRIIFGFFLLCTSIAWATGGDVKVLGGVYTISFLGVMALFATGNILMKLYRGRLRREVRASWAAVIVALTAVLTGIVVNVLADPAYPRFFLMYFLPTMAVIGFMFIRTRVLKLFLAIIEGIVGKINQVSRRWRDRLLDKIDEINSLGIVFFTRGDDIANLNRVMLYVRANEETKRVKIVHVYQDESQIPARLQTDVEYLDRVYPEIDIEFVKVKGVFSPELVDKLSKQFGIPKNYMFLGAPGERFPHNIAEFGGVRLII